MYRVAYGTSESLAGKTFRAFDDASFSTIEAATKRMRAYKRQGFWSWVEDDHGKFVPVPGAKSERVRRGYPLREGHATKKSPAQLNREIVDVLGKKFVAVGRGSARR